MLRLGILDQSPILAGENAVMAMRQTLELAKAAEGWGYSRYWVSEHHDTTGLAGSSPEVLISAIGAHTSRIRVGSAGVLLAALQPVQGRGELPRSRGAVPGAHRSRHRPCARRHADRFAGARLRPAAEPRGAVRSAAAGLGRIPARPARAGTPLRGVAGDAAGGYGA
ncbi:LLM class flavin-dependent oxidoreductase [Paenibacillus sp. P25]|nr:LLM class flavin-dependent oxidoreductase [Paenibacillus sp. P25]